MNCLKFSSALNDPKMPETKQTNSPNKKTLSYWVGNFIETGLALKKKLPGRPHSNSGGSDLMSTLEFQSSFKSVWLVKAAFMDDVIFKKNWW